MSDDPNIRRVLVAIVGQKPIYTEFRKDGWPLCPRCGEDELWSGLDWTDRLDDRPPMQEFIDTIAGCYLCGWRPNVLEPWHAQR